MSDILIPASSGGVKSDDVTTILAHVLAGETALTSDSGDEPGVGTMTVNSLLSFSCAAYSGRRVLAKWQNPKAANGKPYSGVYIRYSASGYPGKTGGTQVYKGAGNNTVSEGQSQAYLDLPNLNTAYYLSIYPYVTCSAGEMTGDVRNATVKTSGLLNVTIKGTQTYIIPAGFKTMDIFCVGGGGGGGSSRAAWENGGGSGGGGGYTATKLKQSVSSGQTLAITVGAGGTGAAINSTARGGTGGVTSVGSILSASGGEGGGFSLSGGRGGSGGGGASYNAYGDNRKGANGGSNGGDGAASSMAGGKGQGTTTRAFGESSGTLYAGGGAGGSCGYSVYAETQYSGYGGAGGGGDSLNGRGSTAGSPNTGGGGAGGYMSENDHTASPMIAGKSGGSGVVLLRFY